MVTEAMTLIANYSYYQTGNMDADPLDPESTDKAIFGAPNHMANVRLNYQLIKNLFISPAAHYVGKIYTMVPDDENAGIKETTQAQKGLLDLYIYSRDLGLAGLELGIGGSNLTNTKEDFSQPYVKTGGHTPLPGPSRELYARVAYNANF